MRRDANDSVEEWKAHFVTEALMKYCDASIAHAQDAWLQASLNGGKCDMILLAEIRARIAVLKEIRHISAEEIEDHL